MSELHGETLDQLCERHGIATRYRDFFQRERVPTEAAKRALLAAMGFAEGSAENTSQRTNEAQRAPLVVRVGESPPVFDLALAASVPLEHLHWHVALESNERSAGPCVVIGPAGGVPLTGSATVRLSCSEWPNALPIGYHQMTITDALHGGVELASFAFIACPRQCEGIPAGTSRLFGPAIQLYALRSRRNWGIGDFTDLAALVQLAAWHGASFVGVNPLHELFLDQPAHASPYSPSSRLALNPLCLDVESVEDFAESPSARAHVASPAFQARLAALRASDLVDYAAVAAAKREVLEVLFEHFRREHLEPLSDRGRAFRAFADAGRAHIYDAALFDALQARFAHADPGVWGWPAWPHSHRNRQSAAVSEFARTRGVEVDFYLYLQWEADRQLAHVAKVARDAGMAIGLYRDLAVGANPGGAETWQCPQRFALAAHVGAPPDEFNQNGQDWGLPPWNPEHLRAERYAPWIALLRANMRHAGGLRIDHVMGLLRLFWIPEAMAPSEGTYVHYPLDDLLAILALESVRNACIVVGEDLGTVPDSVRSALHGALVYSYRVLYFERGGDDEFLPTAAYPAQALVAVSTHDLPTLHGFWQGTDLAARDALRLFPSALLRSRQVDDRAADRARLVRALVREGVLPAPVVADPLSFEQVTALHAYVARAPCALMTVQLEDVFGEPEQVNLPATAENQYPNWRRKIRVDLEDWERDGRFGALCAAIHAQGRGSAPCGNDAARP